MILFTQLTRLILSNHQPLTLLLLSGYPAEFSTYLSYCRSLRFEEKPNYAYLQDLLKQLFYRERFTYDDRLDWVILKHQQDASRGSSTSKSKGGGGATDGESGDRSKRSTSAGPRPEPSSGRRRPSRSGEAAAATAAAPQPASALTSAVNNLRLNNQGGGGNASRSSRPQERTSSGARRGTSLNRDGHPRRSSR